MGGGQHQNQMKRTYRASAIVASVALLLAACGSNEVVTPPNGPEGDPDAPLIQIRSVGGFAPITAMLGQGPTYTVTWGGQLITLGPSVDSFPGELVPLYLEADLTEEQEAEISRLIDEMGIADITEEHDNSVINVADATTEVIVYWDDAGTHRYSVYALGLSDQTVPARTQSFSELIEFLGSITGTLDTSAYEPKSVQIIAGAYYGGFDPELEDLRPWPLDGEDPDEWDLYTTIGEDQIWTCKTFGSEVLTTFADATQTTTWVHPSPLVDAQNLQLLVRPLHPGEPGCEL